MFQLKRAASVCGIVLMLLTGVVFWAPQNAHAAQITSRSLTLVAGATDGGSKPGGVVKHDFKFTVPAVGTPNIQSIQFLYCTTASGTCTMPTGLVTTSATLGVQSGATGFTINNGTNGAPYITRSAATIAPGTALEYRLDTVTNPTTNCVTSSCTFYVRISTFSSNNATGGATDTGTVAASTANQIILTGTMPESLIFCTGGTINTTGGVPDCTTATSGAVSFDRLFSPSDTAVALSQMAASTNAGTGYVISVFGNTMTSGASQITAMTTAGLGVRGSKQFGMNLVANTTATSTPAFGSAIAPSSNGTNFKGEPLTGYDTGDTFKFNSGDNIADSANGGAGPTDQQIYTSSYIVNVSGSTTAGTYTTTLTYICTPTF